MLKILEMLREYQILQKKQEKGGASSPGAIGALRSGIAVPPAGWSDG